MKDRVDFKKEYKELYMPPKTPMIIDVPSMKYVMVDGKGNPNDNPTYQNAMEILYGLSFTIKMSKMSDMKIKGYFDYVIPPLEGLWWVNDHQDGTINVDNKDNFCWTSMIRQPDFVTEEVYTWALDVLKRKKPHLDYSNVRFATYEEGKCVQIMHIGSYDTETSSIRQMQEYIEKQGYSFDMNDKRKHHEIYLGNPRRIAVGRLKTVIRQPIKINTCDKVK